MRPKLGKRPPKFDNRTLMFGAYVTAKLPAPPAAVDYSKKVHRWPMYGNDTLGDCTCAAAGHMIQEWTANTGKIHTISEKAVETAYDFFSGGDPDAGANMLDVLNYWRKHPVTRDRILAFASIDPKNHTHIQQAIQLFGGVYLGFQVQQNCVQDFNAGRPWTPGPLTNDGHAVFAVAYDANGERWKGLRAQGF